MKKLIIFGVFAGILFSHISFGFYAVPRDTNTQVDPSYCNQVQASGPPIKYDTILFDEPLLGTIYNSMYVYSLLKSNPNYNGYARVMQTQCPIYTAYVKKYCETSDHECYGYVGTYVDFEPNMVAMAEQMPDKDDWVNKQITGHEEEYKLCKDWYACGLDHNVPGRTCHNEPGDKDIKLVYSDGTPYYEEAGKDFTQYGGIGSECEKSAGSRDRENAANSWLIYGTIPEKFINQPCSPQNKVEFNEALDWAKGNVPAGYKNKTFCLKDPPQPQCEQGAKISEVESLFGWGFEHACYDGAYVYPKTGDVLIKQIKVSDDGTQMSLLNCDDNAGDPACNSWQNDDKGCPSNNDELCVINKLVKLSSNLGVDQPANIENLKTKTWPFNIYFEGETTDIGSIQSALTGSVQSSLTQQTSSSTPKYAVYANPGFTGESLFVFSSTATAGVRKMLFNSPLKRLVTVKGGNAIIEGNIFNNITKPVLRSTGGKTLVQNNTFNEGVIPFELGLGIVNITGNHFTGKTPIIKKLAQTNCGGYSIMNNAYDKLPTKLIEYESAGCVNQMGLSFDKPYLLNNDEYKVAFKPFYPYFEQSGWEGASYEPSGVIGAEIYDSSGKPIAFLCSKHADREKIDCSSDTDGYMDSVGNDHYDPESGKVLDLSLVVRGSFGEGMMNNSGGKYTAIFYGAGDPPLVLGMIENFTIDKTKIDRTLCMEEAASTILDYIFDASIKDGKFTDECKSDDLCCPGDASCLKMCDRINQCGPLKNSLVSVLVKPMIDRCYGGAISDAELALSKPLYEKTYRTMADELFEKKCMFDLKNKCIMDICGGYLQNCMNKNTQEISNCSESSFQKAFNSFNVKTHSSKSGISITMFVLECSWKSMIRTISDKFKGPMRVNELNKTLQDMNLEKFNSPKGPIIGPGPGPDPRITDPSPNKGDRFP